MKRWAPAFDNGILTAGLGVRSVSSIVDLEALSYQSTMPIGNFSTTFLNWRTLAFSHSLNPIVANKIYFPLNLLSKF